MRVPSSDPFPCRRPPTRLPQSDARPGTSGSDTNPAPMSDGFAGMVGIIPVAPGAQSVTGFQVHQNLCEPMYRNAWLHSDPKDGAEGVLYLVPQAGGGLAAFKLRFKSADGKPFLLKELTLSCLLATQPGGSDGLIAVTLAGARFRLPEATVRGFGPIQMAFRPAPPAHPMTLPADPIDAFELSIGLADSNGGNPQVGLQRILWLLE